MTETQTAPIFIGGTGRSGTSVMAKLIGSHPAVVHPTHENKLIVEKDGLMDLIDQLGGRPDFARQHSALASFGQRARKYRTMGFGNETLDREVMAEVEAKGLSLHEAFEIVARRNPHAPMNLHPLGRGFGLEHYDRCVVQLLDRLALHVVPEGILGGDGIIKPLVVPKLFTRDELLQLARDFLENLYSAPMAKAGAVRWCDDAPANWLYVDFLLELYPDAKLINMVRDPRDVAASYMGQAWAPSDPSAILTILKAQYLGHDKVRQGTPGDRILDVRLEDLTTNPISVMGRVAEFVGLDQRFDLGHVKAEAAVSRDRGATGEAFAVELAPWIERYGYA